MRKIYGGSCTLVQYSTIQFNIHKASCNELESGKWSDVENEEHAHKIFEVGTQQKWNNKREKKKKKMNKFRQQIAKMIKMKM